MVDILYLQDFNFQTRFLFKKESILEKNCHQGNKTF